ncbi:phage terminase large subunit [Ruminococcus sp.]|uniref:phage terminase large subunit n=1 Tax=Ruminococcus sp. TaxID=41978 RepID=UPI00388F9FD5
MRMALGRPNAKQAKMINARTKHVGFGGARGGGKSWAVRFKAKLLCAQFRGIKILIVRRTYEELEKNHIRILRKELLGVVKYTDQKKLMTFPNGSTIDFMYCAKDGDLDRLQGAEFDVIFLDEATQLTEFQMKAITACLRGANNFPKRIFYTANPGGPGHGYIRRIFLDRKYVAGENPDDYTFIQSLVTDNVALMEKNPDYVKQLEALPPKLRAAWRYGEWDIFEGQYFEDFRAEPDIHLCESLGITPEEALETHRATHVIEPFSIPPEWTIYRSFDWGYSKPFSCGWWAVDYDGVICRILELYGCTDEPNTGLKWTQSEVFAKIHEIETTHPWLKGKNITGPADPAIWNAEKGKSTAEIAADNGIYFDKGDNQRIPGWLQVHQRLRFDKNGYPMMYIFSNCKDTIRTLPLLMYDDHKIEDLDTEGEDHIADEIRYFCMSRPLEPDKPYIPSKYYQSMLYQALEIPEGELRKPIKRPRIQTM